MPKVTSLSDGRRKPACFFLCAVDGFIVFVERVIEISVFVEVFTRAHETKAYPAFGIAYQFAEEAELQAGGVCFGAVLAEITDTHIVDIVRHHIPYILVVCFCCEAERAVA